MSRLALLARSVDADVAGHAVVGLVVGVLQRVDAVLLACMRLV